MEPFFKQIGTAFGVVIVGIVIVCLVVARSLVPVMASTFVGGMTNFFSWLFILLLLSLVAAPIIGVLAFLKWFLKPQYYEAGQFGGYARWFRRFIPLPPLAAIAAKSAGATSVTEVNPTIPRLGDLIKQGLLTSQDTDGVKMLVGFRQDESPRYEPLPGVIAITGMQNVGKSVTMLMLIMIAVFQRAHVVICDTHNSKARSLYKKVAALSGFVTFALTESDVLKETRKFSAELHNRKQGSNPYPYIIFYDEFCSLIRSQNEELREALPVAMEEGSQEGQGYGLHIVAAIHDLSNDGIGDARLRSFFNWIFCHRMEAGQSKFIEAFNNRKNKQIVASLPQGHVMVRDEVNMIEYLIIPFGDSRDVLTAKATLQGLIGEYSSIHATRELEPVERSTPEYSLPTNEPVKQIEQSKAFMMEAPAYEYSDERSMNIQVSDEDAKAILNAYLELSKSGAKVTRTAIMEQCGWTRAKWDVIRAYCNERKICMERVQV